MKRILSGLSCWLAVGFSLCGAENLPLLMQTGRYEQVKSLAACRSEIFGLGKSMSIPIGA